MTERESHLLIQLQGPTGAWTDVGLLHHRNESNWFEFLPEYWEGRSRPILGQIFEESGRSWRARTHVALPRWFSHLLPEGGLRTAVAAAAGLSAKREFELLKRLGSTDLPGAVRAIESDLDVRGRPVPTPASEQNDGREDPLLKFSLAGAQLKFSIYGADRGLTVPARGTAGNFIVKFPDGRQGFADVPQAEYAALELARAAGIETSEASLVDPTTIKGLEDWAEADRGPALAVKRFDRRDRDQRVHMEELAQVMDIPTNRLRAKYENGNFETVAIFAAALSGVESVGEVIDRIVLNTLVGNGDAHLKNWSFIYPDGRLARLSPLYDVLPTVLYIPRDDLGLNLDGSKAFEAVNETSFENLGARSGYGALEARQRAASAVERIMSAWPDFLELLSEDAGQRLNRRLATLDLVRGSTYAPN